MLGFADISELAHDAEGLLSGDASGAPPTSEQYGELVGALDVIARALRGELGGEAEARAVVAQSRERIRARPALPGAEGHEPGDAASEPAAAGVPVAHPATAEPAPEIRTADDAPETTHVRRPSQQPQAQQQDRWVQVNSRRVDELCERVADFDMDFNAIQQALRDLLRAPPDKVARLGRPLLEELDRAQTKLQDITTGSWTLRLVPVAPALEELARHAHDLAAGLGKKVQVTVQGSDVQIERAVLDAMWEPMLHVIRNAIDHGIELPSDRGAKPERGSLVLRAETLGPNVVVSVADDGKGIDAQGVREAALARGLLSPQAAAELNDRELVQVVFVHGFSTRAQVSELSGRGVGLDAVRGAVEALGGSAALDSEPGKGTRVSLTLPATVGKESILVVQIGDLFFGIPARDVIEIVPTANATTERIAGGSILRHRDVAIPLRSMSGALGLGTGTNDPFILVLQQGAARFAYTVPSLLGDRELVRRPVDPVVATAMHIHASASLSDGQLVLLLTVGEILRRSEAAPQAGAAPAARRAPKRPRVLVVDDSPIVRELVSEILRGNGLEPSPMPGGEAALAFLDNNHVDVALLDVDMPGMNGFELLQRIRLRPERIPVVMLTTHASIEVKQRALSLGADAYLVKADFLEGSLLKTVRRYAGE
jgi:chemotaxis protein histidine kinase CheA